jgi:hypothetical protein
MRNHTLLSHTTKKLTWAIRTRETTITSNNAVMREVIKNIILITK